MSGHAVFCPVCGFALRVSASSVGRRGPCPGCGARIEITAAGARSLEDPPPPAGPPVRELEHAPPPHRPERTRLGARHGRASPLARSSRSNPIRGTPKEAWVLLGVALCVCLTVLVYVLKSRSLRRAARTGPHDVVSTTVDELLADRLETGTYVRLEAVLLPDVLIQVSEGGGGSDLRKREYILAVAPDSEFSTKWREARAEVDRYEREFLPKLAMETTGELAVPAQLGDFLHVVEKVSDTLQGRGWANRAVAVRLAEDPLLDRSANWKVIFREGGPRRPFRVPRPALPDVVFRSAEEEALIRKIRDDPGYRRHYVAGELALLRWRLDRIAPHRTHHVVARVEKTDALAARTYRKALGREPSAYVSEERVGEEGLARLFVGRLDVLVTSYPPGASLSIDGAYKGRTPHLLRGAPLGKPVRLELGLDSCWPWSETREFRASIAGVERVEIALHPR